MNVVSTFSGVGGLDLGLHQAGWHHTLLVERDEYRRAVLAERFPGVPIAQDVRDVSGPSRPDLVCGGFPCQPWSVAGKRGGESDDRHLWPELLRIIRDLRPRWVLLENVPGLATDVRTLSPADERCPVCGWVGGRGGLPDDRARPRPGAADRDGRVGASAVEAAAHGARRVSVAIPRAIGEVASGLDLDAVGGPADAGPRSDRAAPDGEAPAGRGPDRAPVVEGLDHEAGREPGALDTADPRPGGSAAPAGHESQRARTRRNVGVAAGCPGCGARGRTALDADVVDVRNGLRTVLRDLAHVGSGLGYGVAYRVLDSRFFGVPQRRRRVFIVACDVGGRAGAERAGEVLAVGAGCPGHPPAGGEAGQVASGVTGAGPDGPGRGRDDEGSLVVAHTLRAEGHDGVGAGGGPDDNAAQAGHLVPVGFHMTQDPIHIPDGVPPIGHKTGGQGVLETAGVRRLTPRECEALQGFPPDWTLIDWRGKPAPDSRRYAALGDAVTVPVARWLGERLAQAVSVEVAA